MKPSLCLQSTKGIAMASIFPTRTADNVQSVDYGRRMSSHVAAALVIFAVLQIAVVAKLGGSLVMHLGIFIAIGGFAIAARSLESRWIALSEKSDTDQLARCFRADIIPLWAASLVAPFLWIPVGMMFGLMFN
tara:strand:- start:97 stop:495 length:399 start_codon:yes stop_codon:yes gene_type:complete